MPAPSRTIRLFVSSTFSDFKAERDALQRDVFPRLRDLCQSKGLRFQPIDLRWGISEEAGRDNQTMRICLRELERCQRDRPKPNFLILLGDRYGWRPLPETIPAPLFEQLLAVVPGDLLEWRDDQRPSAKGCYRIDMNAVPPVAVLQPRGEQPKAVWHEQVEKPLLAALEQVPPPLAQALTKAGVSIGTAATHQEIVRGALAPDLADDDRRHVRAFFRTIDGLPDDPPPAGYVDTDNPQARPALEALKTEIEHRIGKRNVCHYRVPWRGDGIRTEDLGEFCAQALQRLSEVVEQQAAAFQQVAPDTLEEQAHQRFGEQRCRRFVGRIATLQRLADYLRQGPLQPLAALGPSGAGKSALMAKAAQAAREVHSNAEVIARYIGATPPSSDLIQLLRNLVAEIRRRYPATTTPSPGADADAGAQSGDADVPFDYPLLINAFHEALQRPTAGQPLLLFLDALDQLTASHHAHGLAWLPANLSPHVRLVVSAALPSATGAGDPSQPAATADPRTTLMAALDARLGAGQRFMLAPLTATDGAKMLANWLDDARRTLQPTQWAAILGIFQTEGSPLWLRTAAEEAARLASWQDPPTYAPTTVGLFAQILDRLSRPAEHGGILVSRTLSYLACARHGLAEDEILDILSADPEVMADFRARSPKSPPVDRLPVAVWVRLYGDLDFYLAERQVQGIGLIDFYHDQLKAAATRAYLHGTSQRQDTHRRMGAYFQRIACPQTHRNWEGAASRTLSELSYQRLHDQRLRYVEHLFCDLRFINASISRGLFEQLLADLEGATWAGHSDLVAMREACFSATSAIRSRPHLAQQTLINRLRNELIGTTLRAYLKRSEASLDQSGRWLCCLSPLPSQRSIQGIIGISPPRKLLHVLTDSLEIANYDIDSLRLIEKQAPFSAAMPVLIIVHPSTGQIAWTDTSGHVYLDTWPTDFYVDTKRHCLAFLGDGIIGVDPQGSLAYYEPRRNALTIIEETCLNEIFATITTTPGSNIAVIMSGDRLPNQQIILVRLVGTVPQTTVWPTFDSTISATCLDSSGTYLMTATRARQLRIYDIESRRLIREASYRLAEARPVRGVARYCRIIHHREKLYALLATTQGELCVWDVSNNIITRRWFSGGIGHLNEWRAIEFVNDNGDFFVATEAHCEVLKLDEVKALELPTAVTGCALSQDGWLVTVNREARSVTWFMNGKQCHQWVSHNPKPTALACARFGGVAFIGFADGAVLRLQAGYEPDVESGLDLFDHPVVGLISLDDERVLACSDNGQFRIVSFRPIQLLRDIRPVSNMREEQILVRLGDCDDFACCGRHHGSQVSVVVIRGDDKREVVIETKDMVRDIAASQDGLTMFAAFSGNVKRYRLLHRYLRRRWVLDYERIADVTHIVYCPPELLGLVLQDQGGRWLEIWSTSDHAMKTMMAAELPFECSSISATKNHIAIGATDGCHCVFSIRNR